MLPPRGGQTILEEVKAYAKDSKKFVGGALSSLAGMNLADVKQAKYLGELTGLGKKKKGVGYKYLFKNKLLDKGLLYGWFNPLLIGRI